MALKRAKWIFAIAVLSVCTVPARPPFDEFEVATVRPTPPEWTSGRFMRMESAHEFVARNQALKNLIAAAYNLSLKAITLPARGPADTKWIDDDHWDILAKAPGDVRPDLEDQMAMLRKLLADRFHLTFHREGKEMAVFTLTVAKGDPKLKESVIDVDASPEGPPPLIFVVAPPLIRLPARHATMAELAWVMQRGMLDRPVLDHTGLTARYDFDLEFASDDSLFGGMIPGPANGEDPGKPGLFRALQEQAGLRLESTRGPVETLVIDTASRPSDN